MRSIILKKGSYCKDNNDKYIRADKNIEVELSRYEGSGIYIKINNEVYYTSLMDIEFISEDDMNKRKDIIKLGTKIERTI